MIVSQKIKGRNKTACWYVHASKHSDHLEMISSTVTMKTRKNQIKINRILSWYLTSRI